MTSTTNFVRCSRFDCAGLVPRWRAAGAPPVPGWGALERGADMAPAGGLMRMVPVLQRTRALTVALAAAVALLWPGAPVAHAWDEWCDTDPLLVVITPRGATVPVFYLTGVYGERNVVAGLLGNL